MVVRKQAVKWQTHAKYLGLVLSVLGGSVGWHETHPIFRTINHAINTAHKTVTDGFVGHLGCIPFDIKGNN